MALYFTFTAALLIFSTFVHGHVVPMGVKVTRQHNTEHLRNIALDNRETAMCNDSVITDHWSDTSPKTADCVQIANSLQTDQEWTVPGTTGKIQLARYESCAVTIERLDPPSDTKFVVNNWDIVVFVLASINSKADSNHKDSDLLGTAGSTFCKRKDGDGLVGAVKWKLYRPGNAECC